MPLLLRSYFVANRTKFFGECSKKCFWPPTPPTEIDRRTVADTMTSAHGSIPKTDRCAAALAGLQRLQLKRQASIIDDTSNLGILYVYIVCFGNSFKTKPCTIIA